MIRLVLMDWGGVLTSGDYDRQLAHDLAAIWSVPEEEVYRAWRQGKRLAVERGDTGLEEAWEELTRRFRAQTTFDEFVVTLREAIVPEAAVIDLLPVLRCRASLGLLSNSYPVVCSLVRKSLGALFDRLFFSNETRRVKPDPVAYRDALHAFGVTPEESLLVDDRERNLGPARELGMAVHLYRDPPTLRDDLVRAGVLVA